MLTQKLRCHRKTNSVENTAINAKSNLPHLENSAATSESSESRKLDRVGVNLNFLVQMKKLLPICIPGVFCRESGLLMILALILIFRTYLDIWFSGFNGTVVRAIVSKDKKSFIKSGIYIFGLMMWPMVFFP